MYGTEGEVWIDYLSGFGANILGYGHPGVCETARSRLWEGELSVVYNSTFKPNSAMLSLGCTAASSHTGMAEPASINGQTGG